MRTWEGREGRNAVLSGPNLDRPSCDPFFILEIETVIEFSFLLLHACIECTIKGKSCTLDISICQGYVCLSAHSSSHPVTTYFESPPLSGSSTVSTRAEEERRREEKCDKVHVRTIRGKKG